MALNRRTMAGGPPPPPPGSSSSPPSAPALVEKSASKPKPTVDLLSRVAAPGRGPREIQFPSPVSVSMWLDDRHVLIGAGGGGAKYGMANVLGILSVDTSVRSHSYIPEKYINMSRRSKKKNSTPVPDSPPQPVWKLVSALDLEGDNPWCGSQFIQSEDESELESGIIGWTAVTHVDCLSFCVVRRNIETNSLIIERVSRVSLQFDPMNADKKPVAIAGGLVVVSQDNNTVVGYSLAQLKKGVFSEAQISPVVTWNLEGRVNQLGACSITVPSQPTNANGGRSSNNGPADVQVLIVALVQDKTMRVATILSTPSPDAMASSPAFELHEVSTLTGKDCKLSFMLTKSSMRQVRLYSEPASASFTSASLNGSKESSWVPVAHMVLLANSHLDGVSYLSSATIAVDAASPRAFRVDFPSEASPITKEGITCLTPCHYSKKEAFLEGLPRRWIIGTVEGSMLAVEYRVNRPEGGSTANSPTTASHPGAQSSKQTGSAAPRRTHYFVVEEARPAKDKQTAKRFPPLHGDPISSIAVSRRNDVVSTDISQHVIISTLPFYETARPFNPNTVHSEIYPARMSSAGASPQEEESAAKDTASSPRAPLDVVVRNTYKALSLFPYNADWDDWWSLVTFLIIVAPILVILLGMILMW